MVHAHFDASSSASGGLTDPQNAGLSQVVSVISVALVMLGAINAILLTWTTVLDARHTLVGALLGIPGGIGLVTALNSDNKRLTLPPLWWLVATVLGTATAVAAITVVPAWLGTRRPVGEVLQSELA